MKVNVITGKKHNKSMKKAIFHVMSNSWSLSPKYKTLSLPEKKNSETGHR
jgi:hypothetical protein